MQTIRISPELIGERLDVRYNAPDAVLARNRIAESGLPLKALKHLFADLVCGPFGSTLTADEHTQTGEILLVQPTNISRGYFSIDEPWHIARVLLEKKGLPLYPPGTFLFARAGVYPHVGVLPHWAGPATISSSMIAGLGNGRIDPYYLEALFRSSVGRPLLYAAQKMTAQPTIGTYELKGTIVPTPDESVQRYIGHKVRQAERLRRLAWYESNFADAIVAGLIEQSITEADVLHKLIDNPGGERHDSAFEEELLKRYATTRQPDSNSRKHSRVSVSFLGDRLDARHYEQRFLDLKIRLRELNAVSLRNVSDKVECGPFGGNAIADELYEADGLPFLRPVNLSGNRFDSSDFVRVSEHRLQSQGLKIYSGENLYFARVGTPCVAMLRARVSISPNVIIVQGNADAADVSYVYCFCKSHFGIMQLEQDLKEGVQPTTSTDAVRNLEIVLPDKRIQKYVGDKCRRSEEFFDLSTRLTIAASVLVEALIEGEVAESTLSSTEAARRRGDYVLDREVLAGLIENRTDATRARPLFPDLDALYAAIDEAERAHTDVETS